VLFNYNDKGEQLKEEDFGFWQYMKYSAYEWLDFFCCAPDSWHEMKKVYETRAEAS
jgi:hypothetical protein